MKNVVRLTLTAVMVLIGFAVFAVGLDRPAEAHDSVTYHYNLVGYDDFWPWDFRDSSTRNFSTKDWPIHFVFYNNATVNRVKGTDGTHRLDNDVFKTSGGAKWARFNDGEGTGWEYDADSGRKRFNCQVWRDKNKWTEHYRVYADNTDDRNWTGGGNYGYYVVATAHYDYDDGPVSSGDYCDEPQFGWDEEAAGAIGYFYYQASVGPRWTTWVDVIPFHNAANYDELIGGHLHHRTSNGSAYKVKVP